MERTAEGLIKMAREFAAIAKSATPGPWCAFTDDTGHRMHTNIVSISARTVCVFSLPGHHKQDADVRLVEAAPDMARLLERMADELERAG